MRNVLLQVEPLKDGIVSPKKIAILDHCYEALVSTLDRYHEHNNNQWGL